MGGKSMATIQELSKLCGVSISTVSKALNGYTDISEKTRDMVIEKANELGYFPNANARSLKLKKTFNIGVLFVTASSMGLRNDYFAHILTSFRDECALRGYDITFIEHYVGRRKMTYLEHCQYRNFDGVCVVSANYKDKEVIELAQSKLPVATVDFSFQDTYSIISDNYNGMKKMTEYIVGNGHKKVAFIHGIKTLVTENRIDGFLDVLEENNITIPDEYIREGKYRNPDVSEKIAEDLLELPDPPTCIIAPDDYSALGVVSAIRSKGLEIVEDISVAGYDGAEIPQFIGVKLATVSQDKDKIGLIAARKLIAMIEKDENVSNDTVFIKQNFIKGNSIRNINKSDGI